MPDTAEAPGATVTQLVVERHRFVVELRTGGRLVPWLGPAFRGITALRHRASECRQPQDTWRTTWQYCRGCPHMPTCGYGQAFEPDAATGHGNRDAPRPLVIAPAFPIEPRARAGLQFHLDLTAIGPAAIAVIPGVIRAIVDAGRFDGLGPDRVRFNLARSEEPPRQTLVRAAALPKQAAALPVVRDVTFRLTAPLFLRERSGAGNRRQLTQPGLVHLLRASMRVARDFFGDCALCSGRGHLDLDDLAASIRPSQDSLLPFSQDKASHRSRERFGMEGVTGSLHFAWLPACLVPWLQLGGIFHAGSHRIAGAGGWDLSFAQHGVAPEPCT